MARRKIKTPPPAPVIPGPPDPPAGVTKVNPEHCFVVVTFGYPGVDRPDEFYYGGPTEEGREAARAAAEAELNWRKSLGYGLKYAVIDLTDCISRVQSDARSDGYQDGYESADRQSRD